MKHITYPLGQYNPSDWQGIFLSIGSIFTWIQIWIPKEMLGRMMSLLILSSNGLVPVSQAISGAVSKWDLNALFVAAGTLVLLVTLRVAT